MGEEDKTGMCKAAPNAEGTGRQTKDGEISIHSAQPTAKVPASPPPPLPKR